ncbi:Nijmegen breakage syndrome 1 protein [Thalictrum thalictroides]|uniref:Nijmegen breakage syndrome 1 protein n=1 Tax=Thalictrum thalictroides TaxID=46969 RepID=A0A7J6WSM7_THATH|nr:Nijmegen breakage syndrome 1 protein [Thalictrum thalictroides]
MVRATSKKIENDDDRSRLKKLALSRNLLSQTPSKPSSTLSLSKTVLKHHGKDIMKKSQRKNRFLFSFPGLIGPITGGKIGELKDLGTMKPILYLDFPQGRVKMFGTIVYPKNRYLTLQFSKGGKNVMCEDHFDNMVVFSDAWWIGKKDENPEEVQLEFPKNLIKGKHTDTDFKGGASAICEQKPGPSKPRKEFVEPETPSTDVEDVSDDFGSLNEKNKDSMEVTPVRQSTRTAGKKFKFTEPSSGDNSTESDSDSSIVRNRVKQKLDDETEDASLVVHTIDNVNVATKTNLPQQKQQFSISAKSKEISSSKRGPLVQATISNLFLKAKAKDTGKRDEVTQIDGRKSGEQKYYIFSSGTYKVGRKGCDVIINTDKGVSRIHAEVIVDSMTNFSSNVHIKDCSKYGTFINKKSETQIKVSEYLNKVVPLKDGDLLSFGTGNATYRFSFFPLIFFVYRSKANHMDHSLHDDISSIGAQATHSWSAECTHVLVDESMPVKEDLLDAIVGEKPIVLNGWVKVVAEIKIRTEIPSWDMYVPTLTLEGLPVKLVDPGVRGNCLAGYTFLLGSLELYKFGDRLRSLLGVGGAKVLSVDGYCSGSEMPEDGANNRVVLVNPPGSMSHLNSFQQLRSLSRVNEITLVLAVLAGHLDQSAMESPSILISSSCSTDETIVEDSDVEMDTVTSNYAAGSSKAAETIKGEVDEHISGHHVSAKAEKIEVPSLKVEDSGMVGKSVNVNELETSMDQTLDILYSQDLIVRDMNKPASVHSRNIGGINFKCFRKRETPSGNSFKNLVPFSKDPYRESGYGNEEVAEHVREEKKRKQIEAIAEDLFNNYKDSSSVVDTCNLPDHGTCNKIFAHFSFICNISSSKVELSSDEGPSNFKKKKCNLYGKGSGIADVPPILLHMYPNMSHAEIADSCPLTKDEKEVEAKIRDLFWRWKHVYYSFVLPVYNTPALI